MDAHVAPSPKTDRRIIVSIGILTILFLVATVAGWTKPHASVDESAHATESAEATSTSETTEPVANPPATPPYWAVLPFVGLLAAIALFPLFPLTSTWWDSNLHRFYAAAFLALITMGYYGMLHPGDKGANVVHLLEHAILGEYIPFIVLLFSLYTISGGVRIYGDLLALPLINTIFLTVGALLASFVGTTGAAMLLIRPLLDTNSERANVRHTVVFFIFVVCLGIRE